ncbi:MAG: hypothetical protein KC657_18860 [Myxococcales bacterium]|nr:hypothetical protein [Myxococcales bacterium]
MFLRRCLAAAAPLLLVSIAACSSDASDGSHGRGGYEAQLIEARQQTQDIYARSIDETEARWERCIEDLEATGVCEVEDGTTPKTIRIVVDGLGTQGWRESLQKARAIVGQVRQALRDAKTKMCEVLAPFAGMQHPYFFYGGNVTGAAGGAAQAGFDVVFDIWNQQAAVFTYKGVGLASLAGGEASAYMGYGFGNKSSVLDAWTGRFCTAGASVGIGKGALFGIPLGAGVGGSLFTTPDQSVAGGAVSVSGTAGYAPPLEAAVFAGDWSAYDAGTTALGSAGFGYRDSIKQKNGKKYVQYNSSVDMAVAMLWNVSFPTNVQVATQVLAVDALKKTGLTLEQACPAQVANAKPPKIELLEKACESIPNPLGDGAPAALSKTDCNDKADGWWCLDNGGGPAWMAYCKGKQIASGCPCASCKEGGVQATCGAAPPPAACPL